MKRALLIILLSSLFFFPSQKAYAFKEDFNFLVLELPYGWEVVKKNEKDFTIKNNTDTASFSYKIMPVHYVEIKQFAEAIMRAYGGYNLKLRASGVYYFDFLSAGKSAWSIVNFCGENACIQTGIGKSKDFELLIDAGELK